MTTPTLYNSWWQKGYASHCNCDHASSSLAHESIFGRIGKVIYGGVRRSVLRRGRRGKFERGMVGFVAAGVVSQVQDR